MNKKRFFLASIVVFVVYEIINYIIHMFILSGAYEATKDIWRADMMQTLWITHVTTLIFSFLFVFIFTKGYEGKGTVEGIRYGVLIGLLMNVVGAFNSYALYPLPFSLVIQWFIYGMVQYIVGGIVASAIYKPAKK